MRRHYYRYQAKRISLKKMKSFKSSERDNILGITGTYSGISASRDYSYLRSMIETARMCGLRRDAGEIIVLVGEDTGVRCKDGQPIIHPLWVSKRMSIHIFMREAE